MSTFSKIVLILLLVMPIKVVASKTSGCASLPEYDFNTGNYVYNQVCFSATKVDYSCNRASSVGSSMFGGIGSVSGSTVNEPYASCNASLNFNIKKGLSLNNAVISCKLNYQYLKGDDTTLFKGTASERLSTSLIYADMNMKIVESGMTWFIPGNLVCSISNM